MLIFWKCFFKRYHIRVVRVCVLTYFSKLVHPYMDDEAADITDIK